MPTDDRDIAFMNSAIEEARRCTSEEGKLSPKVGALVVKDGKTVVAYRGETTGGAHAEFVALEKARIAGATVAGATVYTTLEPCTDRAPGKTPCYRRLLEQRVSRVVVGMLDPNGVIAGKGVELLRDAGVEVDLAPPWQGRAIKELNANWIAQYDEGRRPWRELPSMLQPRARHAVVPFGEGLLVIGGAGSARSIADCEFYSTSSEAWQPAPALNSPRCGHQAAVLGDGSILVVGGLDQGGTYPSFAELLAPGAKEWSRIDSPTTGRYGHSATLLADGRVLVCGGYNYDGQKKNAAFLKTAEMFDPRKRKWDRVGDMLTPRDCHTATLLPNGTVLVVGGRYLIEGTTRHLSLREVEIFDPKSNTFAEGPALVGARAQHAALAMKGGVLVAGGADQCSSGAYVVLGTAEFWSEDTGKWKQTKDLRYPRERPLLFATDGGAPLLVGGYHNVERTERFDAANEQWVDGPSMKVARSDAAVARIPIGRGVLICGGLVPVPQARDVATSSVELFQH
jgi:pyrimidine deaminase RibD-like protein